jgi:hypothetical protein
VAVVASSVAKRLIAAALALAIVVVGFAALPQGDWDSVGARPEARGVVDGAQVP